MVSQISPETQKNIAEMRRIGAPILADIAENMAKKKGENKALDDAGDKFSALASDPNASTVTKIFKLRNINKQLEDPQTKKAVENLLERNPTGFEKVLPQIFANPASTSKLIREELAAAPAQASSVVTATKPAAAATISLSTPAIAARAPQAAGAPSAAQPAPTNGAQNSALAATAAAAPSASAGSAPMASTTPASSVPPKPTEGGMAGFLSFLSEQEEKTPGIINDFDIFQKKIDSNQVPAVTDAYRALTAGGASATSNAALNELKKSIESEPQFFANMNKMMDEKPGLAARIAGATTDPNSPTGKMIGGFIGMEGFAKYANFSQSGIGQMLNSVLEMFGMKGGLDRLMGGLLDMVGGQFRASSAAGQHIQSNNNAQMTAQANAATGAAPSSATVRGPSGDKTEMTGAQLQATRQRSPDEEGLRASGMWMPRPT